MKPIRRNEPVHPFDLYRLQEQRAARRWSLDGLTGRWALVLCWGVVGALLVSEVAMAVYALLRYLGAF